MHVLAWEDDSDTVVRISSFLASVTYALEHTRTDDMHASARLLSRNQSRYFSWALSTSAPVREIANQVPGDETHETLTLTFSADTSDVFS